MDTLLNESARDGLKKKMNKKKKQRTLIECLSCKKTKTHQARGLCSACYWTHSHRPFFESKWPLNADVKYIDPLQKFKKVHPQVQSELDAIAARFPKRPEQVRKRGECKRCLENVFILSRGLCGKCYHFESTSDTFNEEWPSKRQQEQANKKNGSKLIECKKCGNRAKHCARGLCYNCYFTQRAQGGFGEYKCKVYESGKVRGPRRSNDLSVSIGKRRGCLPNISKILKISKPRGRPPMNSSKMDKENVKDSGKLRISFVRIDDGQKSLTNQSKKKDSSTSRSNSVVNGDSVLAKRGRGRPRTNPISSLDPESGKAKQIVQVKRGRGRPRTNPISSLDPERGQAEQNSLSHENNLVGASIPVTDDSQSSQIPSKRGRGRPRKVLINNESANLEVNQQSSSSSVANPETITSELQNIVSAKRPGRPPKTSKTGNKNPRVKRTIPFTFRQTRSVTLQRSLLNIQPELITLEEDEELVIDEQLSSPLVQRSPKKSQPLRISVEQTPTRRNLTSISEQEVQDSNQVQFDDPPIPMQEDPSEEASDQQIEQNGEGSSGEVSDQQNGESPEQQESELENLDEQIKQTFTEAHEQLGQLFEQISDHLTSQISRKDSNQLPGSSKEHSRQSSTSNLDKASERFSDLISTFENIIDILKPIGEGINRRMQANNNNGEVEVIQENNQEANRDQIECITLESDDDTP